MVAMNVGLLFGGRSGEHEVSIRSAQAIARALATAQNADKYNVTPFYIQKDGTWQTGDIAQQVLSSGTLNQDEGQRTEDKGQPQPSPTLWQFPSIAADIEVWFPVLHGPNGEDGTIQGLLTLMQKPFVGSSVLGSAVGMDKIAMKTAFAQVGLPQVAYRTVTRSQVWSNPCVFPKLCDDLEIALGYPCFVKPANLGSSVGIAKVRNRSQLETALDNAASYDRRVIVEAGIPSPREVECAILGNDNPKASVIGEITYQSDFYDYDTKYIEGRAGLIIPAELPAAIVEQIQAMAIQAFQAVDASGLARVDFFYVESTGQLLINEINTFPGFTATSMYPQLWNATGITFPDLVDQLIQLALEQ